MKNVYDEVIHQVENYGLDLEISNAEHFIYEVNENSEKLYQVKINAFKKVFDDWNYIDYDRIIKKDKNLDFIDYFQKSFDWTMISKVPELPITFIKKYKDLLNWSVISKYQKLSESLIEEFEDKVEWKLISYNQEISEDFIRKHKDKIHWLNISLTKKLSEGFINEFKDKLNMTYVRMKSKDFLLKHVY